MNFGPNNIYTCVYVYIYIVDHCEYADGLIEGHLNE